ncbi:hypothetical protein CTheo_4747 [Ceratobasidium theobromae]|uniref:Uncharacterized protein n=1 Tax=Ceratobasidium theobromae TaxID=1582974 RepID=A0A5N5QK06_9AGAM|nr:hypothetical protein CTheo_4747 [Ceratobasidium theobromae]
MQWRCAPEFPTQILRILPAFSPRDQSLAGFSALETSQHCHLSDLKAFVESGMDRRSVILLRHSNDCQKSACVRIAAGARFDWPEKCPADINMRICANAVTQPTYHRYTSPDLLDCLKRDLKVRRYPLHTNVIFGLTSRTDYLGQFYFISDFQPLALFCTRSVATFTWESLVFTHITSQDVISETMRDYRRMLYRLDLATPYQSIPALLQHFMDSSPYNGVIEMRLVTTPMASSSDPSLATETATPGPTQSTGDTPPASSGISDESSAANSPPRDSSAQGMRNLPSSTMVTFQREGGEVNAIALYGTPTSFRGSYSDSRGVPISGPSASNPRAYASGTVTPSRQPSEYGFDPLFAFAPSIPETSSSSLVPVPSSSAVPYGQSLDYGATAYPTPPPMTKRDRQPPPRPISPPFMFPHPQTSLRPPPPPVIRKRFPPRTTLVWAFVPLVQRYLAAGAGTLLFECRSYTTPPSPYAPYGDDPSLDIITRGGPYKRMVGYVGRLFDGGLAVYELADSVAATAAMDSVMLMGMAGVEAVGRSPAIAERGASHCR